MYVRVVGGYLECNLDTTRLDSVILQLEKFKSDYPESEFIPWIQKLLEWRISQRKSVAHRSNYYNERLYTGGIGIEAWGSVRSILVGVPIQFGRVVFDWEYCDYDIVSYSQRITCHISKNDDIIIIFLGEEVNGYPFYNSFFVL